MSRIIITNSNRGAPDPIGLHDAGGTLINPAIKELQQAILEALGQGSATDLLSQLQAILGQLDVALSSRASEATLSAVMTDLTTIKGDIASLKANIDINLSTRASEATLVQVRDYLDTVEITLSSILTQLDVALSTRASEATLQEIRDAVGQLSGESLTSILELIKTNTDNLDTALSSRASEATLIQIRDYLDTVETKLQNILTQFDVVLSTRASEATLIQVRDYLDTVKTKLQTIIDTLDVNLSTRASELTLSTIATDISLIKGGLNTALDVTLSTRASEVTSQNILQALGEESGTNILIQLQDILSKLDVQLSSRATEATLIQVRDYLDTVENKLQTLINSFDVNLSTRASEITLQNLLNATGEQSGTSTLSELQYIKDYIGHFSGTTVIDKLIDIWDKLVELFETGIGKLKIWDGTNQATIDSEGHILVAGKNPVGNLPSSNPVSISGVDYQGKKRAIYTDSEGRIQVVTPISVFLNNTSIQLLKEQLFTAVASDEWQEVLEYTVPNGYDFSCIGFEGFSAVANERIKAVFKTHLGSFDCSTDTFTDGEYLSFPRFDAKLYIYVTQTIGAGPNDTVTITYTNQEGTTGRTATLTIPKNSPIGTRLEVILQTGDYGVIDITNVTHSQLGQAGAFNFEGNLELFLLVLTSSNVQYISPTPPLGSIIIPEGGKIYLQYYANSAVNNFRRINLIGTLIPRG
ncbi:MAG: hypothetical protein JW924_03360 [Fusobacteriaceae bacterium]|nr:hypothetical protein [Fusobacteriaceae bacterium]